MPLTLAIHRPPARDWSRVLPLKEAAALLGVSPDTMRVRCQSDLAHRDLAFVDRPPEGGKSQWFIHRSYDPKLQSNGIADRQAEPDMSGFTRAQRNAAYSRRQCVLKLLELEQNTMLTAPARHAQVIAYAGIHLTGFKISEKSLYRWRALYRDPCDLIALVDQRGGDRRSMGAPEAWNEFRTLFLTDHRPDVRDIWKQVRRIAHENAWNWCNYRSCLNQLNKRIPPQDQTKYRDPAKYRSSLAPYIELDKESFAAGKMWISDHKALDLICSFEGRLVRPWITVFIDWRTRKVCGHVVSESPNSSTILAAFRHGVLKPENRGGPAEVWIDNGKDYSSWLFHGTTKRQRQIDCRLDDAAIGIFEGVGVQAHFAIPYGPNGKARCERWFRQTTKLARTFATYCGESVDTKPESLADVLADPKKIPTFAEVKQRVDDFIRGENADADHAIDDLCEDGERLSPDEAFRRWVTSERQAIDPAAYDLFLQHWSREVRVGRNGIAIAIAGVTLRYGQFEPLLAPYKAARQKHRVALRVAYDPDNVGEIKVYHADWSFICTATMNQLGGRGVGITTDDVKTTIRNQRRYTRARADVDNLAITRVLTNEEQIAVNAHQRMRPPESIQPLRTPLDGQSKAVQRERMRKAAGAEHQHHDDSATSPADFLSQYRNAAPPRRTPHVPNLLTLMRETLMTDDYKNTDSADATGDGVMEALNQQDRNIYEARMLPTDQPLTPEQINGVRTAFHDRMHASDVSMAKVAKQLRCSPSVLSEWAAGKYAGDVEKITRSVNAWIGRESRRAANAPQKTYVETAVAENMRTLIRAADDEHSMCVIVGPSGCGKTLVLQAMTEELNAVYVSLEDSMSPVAFLRRLSAYLGIPMPGKAKDMMHLKIVSLLRATKQVIIIDEAQHLQTKTISTVRAIHDQSGVSIVMAGSAEFLNRSDDRTDGRGQFSSRCLFLDISNDVCNVTGPHDAGRRGSLFSVEEVKAFFARRSIKLHIDAIDMLWAIANIPGWGSFRVLERIASITRRRDTGRALTRTDIRMVLKLIMPKDLGAIDRMTEMYAERMQPTGPKMAATA